MGLAALGLLLQTILDMDGGTVLLFLMNATERMGVTRKDVSTLTLFYCSFERN